MNAKTCTRCGEAKPLEAFGTRKLRSGEIGRKSHCRDCVNAKNRAVYAADPAPTIARTTARNKANADEHRATARKSMAKRRAEQPEAVRNIHRKWVKNNPEKVRFYEQQKRERNPDLYRAIGRATTARRRARLADAYVEDVDRASVWSRDSGLCHLCGRPAGAADWQLEHIVPLAAGGAHSYRNTAVSHPFCNQSKNDRWVPSALGLLGAFVVRPVTCA
jgi:hypothetical protein